MSARERERSARAILGEGDCSTGCWLLTLLGLYRATTTATPVDYSGHQDSVSFQNGVRFCGLTSVLNFGLALLGFALFARASLFGSVVRCERN